MNTASQISLKFPLKVLWLAPNFNHYKARFLNYFASASEIELSILAGSGRQGMGDQEINMYWDFQLIRVGADKNAFGFSREVRQVLKNHFKTYNWVMVPMEKKNILLLLYTKALQMRCLLLGHRVKLFSYNHPLIKSSKGEASQFDRFLTWFYFKLLNKVVFYTEQSYKWVVSNKLVKAHKAAWANNTLDTHEIKSAYQFSLPPENDLRILFIGRLIPSKRVDILLDYYQELKKVLLKEGRGLILEIIGDGPESKTIKEIIKLDSDIVWHGTLVDEKDISPIMERISLVFIPGLSGLSINHAFAYGRPYVTLTSKGHGPEIAYLINGNNGLILKGDFNDNVKELLMLLKNKEALATMSKSAHKKSQELSVDNWVINMKKALK